MAHTTVDSVSGDVVGNLRAVLGADGTVNGATAPNSTTPIPIDFSGLFNFNPANYKYARKALANAALGLGNMQVLCLGDSTTAGYDGVTTANETKNSWVTRLADQLTLSGIQAGWQNCIGGHSNGTIATQNTYDTRLTALPAGWTSFGTTGNAIGGEIFNNNTTTNPLTFTPANSSGVGITTDTLDVWYYDGAGYSTITVLGGAAGLTATVASNNVPAGSNTIKKATFTLAGTSVWKLNGSGAAGMIIFGISASTSAANNASKQSEVTLLNVGRGGAGSLSVNYNAQLWESLQTISSASSAMVSPLAIYSYGLNDLATTGGAAAFYTNAATTITALKAAGTDVLLVVPPPVAAGLTPYYSLYAGLVSDYYKLASTFGLALIDLNTRWTSNAVAQPLGYYTNANDIHPSIMGYGDYAKAVSQFFKRL